MLSLLGGGHHCGRPRPAVRSIASRCITSPGSDGLPNMTLLHPHKQVDMVKLPAVRTPAQAKHPLRAGHTAPCRNHSAAGAWPGMTRRRVCTSASVCVTGVPRLLRSGHGPSCTLRSLVNLHSSRFENRILRVKALWRPPLPLPHATVAVPTATRVSHPAYFSERTVHSKPGRGPLL